MPLIFVHSDPLSLPLTQVFFRTLHPHAYRNLTSASIHIDEVRTILRKLSLPVRTLKFHDVYSSTLRLRFRRVSQEIKLQSGFT